MANVMRITLKAYDHQLIDASAAKIVDNAKKTGSKVKIQQNNAAPVRFIEFTGCYQCLHGNVFRIIGAVQPPLQFRNSMLKACRIPDVIFEQGDFVRSQTAPVFIQHPENKFQQHMPHAPFRLIQNVF